VALIVPTVLIAVMVSVLGSAGPAAAASGGDIIITEVMYNPDISDLNAEWVEVHNTTGSAIDLNGFTFADAATSDTIDVSVVVPAGGYAVLCRNGNPAANGGVTCDFDYDDALGLNNFAETVTIADGVTTLDEVAYDDGGAFPMAVGSSINLDPSSFDATANDDGANWCLAITALGDDRGTPGAANDACPATTVADGQLIISEIMYDPDPSDFSAEWVEVHNTTGSAIDLQGLLLSESGRVDTIVSSVVVAAGDQVVLCRDGNPAVNGGVTCDYDYDDNISFNNFADTVGLLNNDRTLIDEVPYDDGATFPAATGASISLDPAAFDSAANDDGSNWCLAITALGGDWGTPGATNDPCPITSLAAGQLVITEIMYDPWPSDFDAEWIEIHNPTGSAIDLNGLLLSEANRFTTITSSVVVAPGGYAVLCIDDDVSANGGVVCDYDYDDGLTFNNFPETVGIQNNDRSTIDIVAYDDGGNFPDAKGVSIALDPTASTAAANDNGANWCLSVDIMTAGAGTPGAVNDSCTDTYSCDSIAGTSADFAAAGWTLQVATAGDDTIELTSAQDQAVLTFAGNDNVTGSGFGDLICLGAGDDFAIGRSGDDIILGGLGNDTIAGNGGDDTLRGEDGNDVAFGGGGDDVISGSVGNDRLGGSSGADTITGGAGADVISGGSDTDINVSGGADNDAVNGGGGDDSNVNGDGGDDTVSGNGGNDSINGGDGNDQVRGGPGDDQVFGDAGDDLVAGNDGFDTCDGGAGTDIAPGNCEVTVNVP
jgi:Ca2+-binding RTX toxin-like protein